MNPREADMRVKLANAPVSFGVFELTVGRQPNLPTADQVLDAVAGAGYEGVDLGPLGFLGEGPALREALAGRGLGLAGGYVALRLTDAEGLKEDLRTLERTLDSFQAVAGEDRAWWPKPTLADAGSPARAANPGRGKDMPELRLDEDGWRRLAQGVARAADLCRARGFEPTFHHHACTHVEAPQEIERFLELTDVGLCLDPGHLLLGGGDPVPLLRAWRERINHLHLKDARISVLEGVIAERAEMVEVWRRGAFCELGQGDLDLDGFLGSVREIGYRGWAVIEQDRILGPEETPTEAAAAQVRNLATLRRRWAPVRTG